MTVFEDKNYQIFYTDDMNGVYVKSEERVYTLSIDAWTKMVLKLESVINPYDPHKKKIWQ